jgi:hypothetical protein
MDSLETGIRREAIPDGLIRNGRNGRVRHYSGEGRGPFSVWLGISTAEKAIFMYARGVLPMEGERGWRALWRVRTI